MDGIVEIKICFGTLCFIMGGSAFEMLGEHLPVEFRNKVRVQGMNCPGYCQKAGFGKPPFVMVNQALIEEANIQKVIAKVREELSHGANQ